MAKIRRSSRAKPKSSSTKAVVKKTKMDLESEVGDTVSPKEAVRLQCDVCTNRFSFAKRSRHPLVGQCGHSFCRRCTSQLNTRCPTCRAAFVPSANYALMVALEEIEQMKEKIRRQKDLLREAGVEVDDDSGTDIEEESEVEDAELEEEEQPPQPRRNEIHPLNFREMLNERPQRFRELMQDRPVRYERINADLRALRMRLEEQ